jgi:hypothetical protein
MHHYSGHAQTKDFIKIRHWPREYVDNNMELIYTLFI